MSQKTWVISYRKGDGETGAVNRDWSEKPTQNDAAMLIRDHLLGKDFLLVDMPRGHSESAVYLLKSNGFEITNIEEAEK